MNNQNNNVQPIETKGVYQRVLDFVEKNATLVVAGLGVLTTLMAYNLGLTSGAQQERKEIMDHMVAVTFDIRDSPHYDLANYDTRTDLTQLVLTSIHGVMPYVNRSEPSVIAYHILKEVDRVNTNLPYLLNKK